MAETQREMGDRHVREQVGRIEKQVALIRYLDSCGLSTEVALDVLADMQALLSQMRRSDGRMS